MNKVYRVIWSQVKNGYVVVSELAKRSGKCCSGRSKEVLATVLVAGAVLSINGAAWAEEVDMGKTGIDNTQIKKYTITSDSELVCNWETLPKTTELKSPIQANLSDLQPVKSITVSNFTNKEANGKSVTTHTNNNYVKLNAETISMKSYDDGIYTHAGYGLSVLVDGFKSLTIESNHGHAITNNENRGNKPDGSGTAGEGIIVTGANGSVINLINKDGYRPAIAGNSVTSPIKVSADKIIIKAPVTKDDDEDEADKKANVLHSTVMA